MSAQEIVEPHQSTCYELLVATPGSPDFETAQQFTQEQYKTHFHCEIAPAYPEVFCFYKEERIVACCGIRRAGEESLFLEQYLTDPIENAASAVAGYEISRSSTVEIGGFAAINQTEALAMMIRMAPALQQLGFCYATCTVTLAIRRCLKKLGVESHFIAIADPNKIDDAENWGLYYRNAPIVLGGAIQPAIDRLAPLLPMLTS